jgi:hypothetical protein
VGNIGLALAHLGLWEHLYKTLPTGGLALLFEDDEIIDPDFVLQFGKVLDAVGRPLDIINLNALRASGTSLTDYDGLYRMTVMDCMAKGTPCRDRNTRNVWLSAYVISKEGIGHLLSLITQFQPDISNVVFDHAVSFAAQSSKDLRAFALAANTISRHREADSFRRKFNLNKWSPSSTASLMADPG